MQGHGVEEGLHRPARPGRGAGGGKKKVAPPKAPAGNPDWTGWRGPARDGRLAWLPAKLPEKPTVLWRATLLGKGLGGVAATSRYVVVSSRELMDTTDAYTCFDARTGKELWKSLNPAAGELDYGNSPRATPLIHGEHVFLFGAFGQLHCVELATGKTVWEIDAAEDFGVKDKRKWGLCSSPLIADGKLILNPGGKDASLVALDPKTGKVLWKSPGKPASYGNLIAGTFGGKKQVVGFDSESLGGWDLATGKRLWRLTPERRSDFNVPTPIPVGDDLLIPWENNGALLYRFTKGGQIDPKPLAKYARLAPDTHTPVVTAGRVFGAWNGLHCLDLHKKLAAVWVSREAIFSKYLTAVASPDRVLLLTITGELILLDPKADAFKPISRVTPLPGEAGFFSHPAFVGTRMYLRGEGELLCLDLAG